MELCLF